MNNGVMNMKGGSPFKPATSASGSMFSTVMRQSTKGVGLASKYNDSSMYTQMKRINARKPVQTGVDVSYKSVSPTKVRRHVRYTRAGGAVAPPLKGFVKK